MSGRPIAERGALSLALRGAELAAQALLILVTARFLGPDGRGLYALASLTATLCVVPLGSVWSSLAVDVAKRTQPLYRLVGDAAVVAAAGGALVALTALAVSPAFGARWWVVALPAAVTPALLWLTYVQGLLQALGHVVAFHAILVARVVAPLAFVSAALVLGAGAEGVLVAWAAAFLALVPVAAAHVVRVADARPRPSRTVRPYVRRIVLGARFIPTNTVLMLSVQVGLLFLAALASTATVGVYSVAIAGAELLKSGARAVYSSVLAGVGERRAAEAATLTARATRHSVALGAAGAAVAVPVSLLLVPILLGPGFEDVSLLLALLAPSVVAYGAFLAVTTYFSVQEVRPEVMTVASAALLATTLAAMALLVAPLGPAGAALATSLGGCVGAAALVATFVRRSGCPIRALVPGRHELEDYVALVRSLRARFGKRRAEAAVEGA